MLRKCCGSTRWVERMMVRRPFRSQGALLTAAREIWFDLSQEDWREAFEHHPRIGDMEAVKRRFAATRQLSEKEQAGIHAASDDTIRAFAEANAAYEAKFGYIFIVSAAGRTADEMLALLRQRSNNDAETEIRIAANEQAKITELRLLGL